MKRNEMASSPNGKICVACRAELGPWEGRRCLSCGSCESSRLTNADAALLVLERTALPLTVYDIGRGIARDCRREVAIASLNVALAVDRRFCWAGRGLYGLYRHGVYPGPRNFAGVARLFLLATEPQSLDALRFVMRQAGYRVQRQSLYHALESDELIRWSRGGYGIADRVAVRSALLERGTGTGPATFARCIDKCRSHTEEALREYGRRLRKGERRSSR